MLLSLTSEYALRAMAHIATGRGSAVRSEVLARSTGIPAPYLSKIMRRLVRARLLRSHKGHGGGFRLARPPDRIRFADIIGAVGGPFDPTRCVFGWGRCSAGKPCPLHDHWTEIRLAFHSWAQRSTLADFQARQP
ncbi:MAG TPA: Rrf2 family transcriptional regulator [Planctomycetota bacterium]|nr:Rrf2 family transcriptional regulator [Planctomycetota bacterium]